MQIIRCSFSIEPHLLTETEIHRESVTIFHKGLHIENIVNNNIWLVSKNEDSIYNTLLRTS